MRVSGSARTFQLAMNDASPPDGHEFYCQVLDILEAANVDFLVGGAFALGVMADIHRDTKDFDLMLRPGDVERALQACREAGFRAEFAYSHWIAKIHHGDRFIDLIYRAGNGLCEVDDEWFQVAPHGEVMGRPVRLCPAEEVIWQKAFIMERERFDGADIQHILRARASQLDWPHLLRRFGDDWRVLFSHLVLFGYIYPDLRGQIPAEILRELSARLTSENTAPPENSASAPLCRGTLLSRAQYLPDVEQWGNRDARRDPRVAMTPEEITVWTNAIDHR